jgi:catechol 2,3-dioxygenase-like lactoylglutathione lyase family enzyme
MKIALTSVMVDDQAKALAFYTDRLGFTVRHDISLGAFRWLTVVSPEGAEGVELLLEPNAHPAAVIFQKALFDDGIPATSFESADVAAEHARLVARGVVFRKGPTPMGPTTIAVFDDTCGNLIQLHQAGASVG